LPTRRPSPTPPPSPKLAKVNRTAPISRRDIIKSRRRIHFRRDRGGNLYASAWPPLRGKKKTPLQQAWVDNFKFLASAPKLADGCALSIATPLAKDTGYFWRDVISSALSGKLLHYKGSMTTDPPLPRLYADQVTKDYEGAPRVTTPTASLKRTSYQNMTQNVPLAITMQAADWDNNAFWSSTTNPSRLTIKSSGLYIVLLTVTWQPAAEFGFMLGIRLNGTQFLGRIAGATRTAYDPGNHTAAIWYFNAGDYIEAMSESSSVGCSVRPDQFAILGMTPESII